MYVKSAYFHRRQHSDRGTYACELLRRPPRLLLRRLFCGVPGPTVADLGFRIEVVQPPGHVEDGASFCDWHNLMSPLSHASTTPEAYSPIFT